MPWKKKPIPIPEASRFDRMTETDLFLSLEASLMTAGAMMQRYSNRDGDKSEALALLQSHLEDATAITKAMRRKLVVILPNS
jgi:hypothetical protein